MLLFIYKCVRTLQDPNTKRFKRTLIYFDTRTLAVILFQIFVRALRLYFFTHVLMDRAIIRHSGVTWIIGRHGKTSCSGGKPAQWITITVLVWSGRKMCWSSRPIWPPLVFPAVVVTARLTQSFSSTIFFCSSSVLLSCLLLPRNNIWSLTSIVWKFITCDSSDYVELSFAKSLSWPH